MLKAYKNLNFKQSSLDATGRLTREDIDRILDSFSSKTNYESISASNFDLAMNGTGYGRVFDLIIPIREYELTSYNKTRDERKNDPFSEVLRGFIFGHMATSEDYKAIFSSKPPKKLATTFPMMIRTIRSAPELLIIDGFCNMSQYTDSVMLAFLLRKLQMTGFGSMMSVICVPGSRIDGHLGSQLIKFGYRPLSLCSFDDMDSPASLTGTCSLMVAMRTRDSREAQQ